MARIPGVQTASWNSTAFARFVVRARDNFGPSFVAHRIPHRNGAKQEQTGNVPFKVVYDLEFAGRSWADDAKRILNAFIERPRGDLVHHLRGKVRAVVKPIDASWDPVNKGTHYAATVTLEEDTLTNNVAFDRSPGSVGDDLAMQADGADLAAANFTADVFAKNRVGIPALQFRAQSMAAQTLANGMTSASRTYASAALSQFQAGQLQPSLGAKLGLIPSLLDNMILAYRAMPHISPYAQVSIDAAEATLYQARLLDRAIRANLPPPIRWRVQQRTSLMTLVGRIYPSRGRDDKFALVASIALQNGLSRPDAIAAGRTLVVPAP
jgi:hypothetical protein